MHQLIVAQMLHPGAQVLQHQQELVLRQSVRVLRVVEDVEEAAAGAELHHDHLASPLLVLLDGQQLYYVLMIDLLKGLKLPHLHICWAHVTVRVEGLDRH